MPFTPLSIHRIAHRLHARGHRRLARIGQALIYFVFKGIIPPEVEFGEHVRFGHNGFGVVIHPNTTIGDHVLILHHVTLATDVPSEDPRRMVVGSGVVIGAGAILLGPLAIGDGATIGAGAVVTKDVPRQAVVAGNPARVLRIKEE